MLKVDRNEKQEIVSIEKSRVYFPRSEFHARFPSVFSMKDPIRWSTYHRSRYKKLEGALAKNSVFLGNQPKVMDGMHPKTGNFFNPFHFEKYRLALRTQIPTSNKIALKNWYDELLKWQKEAACFIVSAIKSKDTQYTINADNNYPCVLINLPKPPEEKNDSTWNNFLSLYLVTIANKLALEKGLNIELVRRSSFDSLRPSVSECHHSLRISLGLTPKAYHECIVEALIYLDKLFLQKEIFSFSLDNKHINLVLKKYNKAKSTATKPINILVKETCWDSLWTNGDSKNKSFATQLFRNQNVVEYFIDEFLSKCLASPLEKIFSSAEELRNCFAKPLQALFNSFTCTKDTLSLNLKKTSLKSFEWLESKTIDDPRYWSLLKEFAEAISAPSSELDLLLEHKKLADIFSCFEIWLANFTFQPHANSAVTDGPGSDSEEEIELEGLPKPTTIYSKKFITATGMRSIQLSSAVAKLFLQDFIKIDPIFIELQTNHMYYETTEALHTFPIPIEAKAIKEKATQSCLRFFDLNHCNTNQEQLDKSFVKLGANDKIVILDITSATTAEIADTLYQLWKKYPKLEHIITVSSGLKNEQGMSDYNPYGTIRLFSKNKTSLESIFTNLLKLEETANYKHPKESHLIRKTYKSIGFTPTNKNILEACEPKINTKTI